MAKHAKRLARARKAGFSLVELIIVIAIMVALIAVMAPAYVKYVQKSHDAVLQAAAESVLQFVKAEMGDGSFTGVGKMEIKGVEGPNGKKYINIEWIANDNGELTLNYMPGDTPEENNGYDAFIRGCGVDQSKQIKSSLVYEIEVYDNSTVSGHPDLQASMEIVGGS